MNNFKKVNSDCATVSVASIATKAIKSAAEFEQEAERVRVSKIDQLSSVGITTEEAVNSLTRLSLFVDQEEKQKGDKRNGSLSRQQAFGGLFKNKY